MTIAGIVIADIAGIAGIGKSYRGLTRMSADQKIAMNAKIAKDRRNGKTYHGGTETRRKSKEGLFALPESLAIF